MLCHLKVVQVGEREMRVTIESDFGQMDDCGITSIFIDKIKLFLDYCIRFYDRQFITRENQNSDLLARFELLLDNYFKSNLPVTNGIPTVQYCADKLCLSTNYFSDLLRKETGLSAGKHIQRKVLDIAKERLYDPSKSVSQIATEMGFQYPQHFSRWFKKLDGRTPNEYRQQSPSSFVNTPFLSQTLTIFVVCKVKDYGREQFHRLREDLVRLGAWGCGIDAPLQSQVCA